MFDSRSPVVKIGGYIIIGFFTVIIVISFGVPEFMSRLGMDQSIVAVINGEKVHILEYLRYRDNITRRYKKLDLYFGVENLTAFRQEAPIIAADNPFSDYFDAGLVWGPLMGRMFYGGIRITIN